MHVVEEYQESGTWEKCVAGELTDQEGEGTVMTVGFAWKKWWEVVQKKVEALEKSRDIGSILVRYLA